MKNLNRLLASVLLLPGIAGAALEATAAKELHQPATQLHYRPQGNGAVCIDGTGKYNRALYGAHTGFRMECSDMPVFGIYLPGMGGNIAIDLPAGECRAVYTPGRMDYDRGGVHIEAQVLRSSDAALWRLTNNNSSTVNIPVVIGGVSGKNFSRNGDLGVDPADCFELKKGYSAGNVINVDGDKVGIEYGARKRDMVTLLVPSSSHYVTEQPVYEGVITLEPGQSKIMAYFPEAVNVESSSLPALLDQAEAERAALAGSVDITTPDPWLNPVGQAMAIAADGIWSGEAWLHGSIGWRTPHLGWRGAYCGDALGWHDRSLTHMLTYASNQVTDRPATIAHPAQSPQDNMARALKKWGTPMYSNGYICRRPGKLNEMSHYDMNMVYADAMVRHFLHTGDTASMRRLWPVLKRHLAWEKLNFDPDGDHLYDAYCCIWASDALYYNGGAVTHSSAYNYLANKLAADVARAIGEDPSPYDAEAAAILAAVDSTLWMPDKGVWAEFKELGGHSRLHPYPAVWTVYHAIDSRVGTPWQRYAATSYVDREIPHLPIAVADTLATISTTNWKPYSWSINNVALAEVMHTALAYWQAQRNDEAYRLMKAVVMDNMYSGACPLNFGQISQYDASRGECYRDFADPIGVWSRALTEGLYGITPDMLSAAKTLAIRPGFPSGWNEASIKLPDVSYSFERKGNTDTYTVHSRYGQAHTVVMEVPALGLKGVSIDGKKAKWMPVDNCIGTPLARIELPAGRKVTLKVDRSSRAAVRPAGETRSEGPVEFTLMSQGDLTWWQPVQKCDAEGGEDIFTRSARHLGDFAQVDAAKCATVDLTGIYNAGVSDIFRNEYASPRPQVTTLQIPLQGIGEWCHPKETAEINDSVLRAKLTAQGGRLDLLGIPFAMPGEGNNIAYTTLWDNYPASVTLDLAAARPASHAYMLMAGSTNHMQWGMENVRLTLEYTDGTTQQIPLVNPVSWAPIEQQYYVNGYAYSQPHGLDVPMRVPLATLEAKRNFQDGDRDKTHAVLPIAGGAATLLDVRLDPSRTLAKVTVETISQDVVAGLMGLTLQGI